MSGGLRLALFPLAWKAESFTLSSRELLNQRGIVVTGTPALAFASEAAPNTRPDPRAIIGQFIDQSGLYYFNARYYDAGMRHTDQSVRVHAACRPTSHITL